MRSFTEVDEKSQNPGNIIIELTSKEAIIMMKAMEFYSNHNKRKVTVKKLLGEMITKLEVW